MAHSRTIQISEKRATRRFDGLQPSVPKRAMDLRISLCNTFEAANMLNLESTCTPVVYGMH